MARILGDAQVRPARAGELGADFRVVGRGDVLRGQRLRAGDEAAIVRRAVAGTAEHADEQGGITAAVPIVERRVRGERFLIVGGRCAAKRSNMAGLPFFLVRGSG